MPFGTDNIADAVFVYAGMVFAACIVGIPITGQISTWHYRKNIRRQAMRTREYWTDKSATFRFLIEYRPASSEIPVSKKNYADLAKENNIYIAIAKAANGIDISSLQEIARYVSYDATCAAGPGEVEHAEYVIEAIAQIISGILARIDTQTPHAHDRPLVRIEQDILPTKYTTKTALTSSRMQAAPSAVC